MKLSKDALENEASKFRSDFGLSLTEAINFKSLLRKLNILTIFRPMSDSIYGISLKSNSNCRFMLINSKTTRGRQHYTIAHEFFHLYIEEHPTPHIYTTNNGGKNISEINADSFAATLLMPKSGIMQFLSTQEINNKNIDLATILRIEQYYGVSRQALIVRLDSLRLLSKKEYERLSSIRVIESAKEYGYDLSLYKSGNQNLIIGDFGEKAKKLFDNQKISEGHYLELLNLLNNGED